MKKSIGVGMLALFVAACGGGNPGTDPLCTASCIAKNTPAPPGPSPAPAPATSQLEGFFSGTTSNGYDFGVVALPTGEIWGIYIRGGAIYGAVHGSVQATQSAFAGSGYDFYLPTGTRTASAVSGTFASKTNIAGTISSNGATFTGTYDSSYDTPATSAAIQGTWSGQAVSRAGVDSASVTIAPDGHFTGHVSTCSYSGLAAPKPGGKNVFDMTVTFAGSGCLFNSATLSGIAVVRNGQLITLALLPDGSDGFMALAHR
jgi:hypothetical protein